MKERALRRKLSGTMIRAANHLVNAGIALLLLIAFLYSGYGLWDTWQIYESAGLDQVLLTYKPVQTTDLENPTLSELQSLNSDVCAWLTVDGTNIDYPIVRGESNIEYINKDINGEFSLSGSVFLDYRNEMDFTDFYSLVYAHHMEGNVMFGEVPNFLETDYFQEHTGGMLYLPEGTFEIKWFACISTDAYDVMVFNPSGLSDEAEQSRLLSYLREVAVQYREIGVTAQNRILGLSTCAESSADGRVLLFGKLCAVAQETGK
jgi:sortase B